MKHLRLGTAIASSVLALGGSAANAGNFELWLVDQSNSFGKTYGGALHIFEGSDLMGESAATAPDELIDLGTAVSTLCLASTGANPVRPHMLVFNRSETHAALSFVASGHVVIFDARTRAPLFCTRMAPGAGGLRQAHAVFPTADDHYVLVANQNGKRYERIAADYVNNVFTYNPAHSVDLAGCTTPSGAACQAAGVRPDNAPICPFQSVAGGPAFVSLRGGGMFAVDPNSTPMSIVGEWDMSNVTGNGCGFQDAKGWLYFAAGGGSASNLDQFTVYRTSLGASFLPTNPPNSPAVQLLFNDLSVGRDAHGVIASQHEKYVWFFDRHADVAEVFDADSGTRVESVDLRTPDSTKLTPDLAAIAPEGNRIFLSLRGPVPLSGDPHASTGATPGLGIVQVTEGGQRGFTKAIRRISNIDAGGIERADAHGIRLRKK